MESTLILNVTLMLGVTIAAILVLSVLLRLLKKVSLPTNENVEVVGGANLGGKSKIFLIKVNGRQLLIGATEQNINTLLVYDKSEHTQ